MSFAKLTTECNELIHADKNEHSLIIIPMKTKMKLSHPGEILKIEIIEGRGLTIGKAAELLGVTRPTLSNILNGKSAITPNIALRIETVFGGTARFWLRLQSSYDLFVAKIVFDKNPPKISHYDFV